VQVKKLAAALALAGMAIGSAHAKEGGDQYPNGIETWFAGALPPPGTYFLNYFGYYTGDLQDGRGKEVKDASVDAWFDALRIVHVTDVKILGGDWLMHAVLPLVHQKVELGRSESVNGIGDITISPFDIAWHHGNWHWVAGLDINLPTGRYKEGEPRESIGANYWSFEPLFGITYLGDTGWEVSAKLMYNIKTENEDFRPAPGAPRMDYQSGDEFHMDYLVGKHIGPWGVGLSGYYLKQTTDDELEGEEISSALGPWSDGRRGQVFAIGPSVSYTTKEGVHFSAHWHRETEVENRFEGDKFVLKLIMPL
jgi:hypothetical protein